MGSLFFLRWQIGSASGEALDSPTCLGETSCISWHTPGNLIRSYHPQRFQLWLGAATCAETLLGVALVLGVFTRVAAFLSGWLLLLFALSMTFALGLKAPLNFSVFTASAAAFLLATCGKYSWSLDSLRKQPERNPMRTQASMPAITLMTVGVAATGFWGLSATATTNQAHETGKNTRVAISETLPRMDADHLEAKVIEVTYQPGASSPAHGHPCPVLAYVTEGTIRSQVNDEPAASQFPRDTATGS